MNELVSATLGIVIGVILNDPLIRLRDSIIHWIKRFFLKRKRKKPYTGLFHFGNKESTWLIVDGDGEETYEQKNIFTYFDKDRVQLPPDLLEKQKEVEKEQKENRKKGLPYHFNGESYKFDKFSLNRFSSEEALELHLWFRPTDYYTFLATDMSLNEEKVREKYFPNENWTQPEKYFANSFGVNLVVITKDEHIVLTKRSGLVGTNKGMYHISVNEGLSRTFDRGVSTQAPDIYRAGIRGIVEELGAVDVEAKDISYLSLGVDTRFSQWGILGKARISKTSEELKEWRSSGVKDKWENEEFFTIPLDLTDIVKFVADHDPWTPAGLTCLYHTLVSEFGREKVEKTIQKYLK
ncbi:MAG TPA: hypothetical protein VEW42_02740 [Candidatus Eisenbacteria bacterium]|nr:hypothetical protein [Candidatus Eisenbacteria bacterium]